MILVRPKTIDDATLSASNISETAPAAWSSGTNYAEDVRVSVATGTVRQVYKSLAGGNLANDPSVGGQWWAADGTTYAAYSGGTTYAEGDRVIDATAHRVYESLAASNTGHPLTDPAWWLDIGPTNKWAMFDSVVGTATTHPYMIEVEASFSGRVDSIAMLGLTNAISARIVMTTAADGVIYDQALSLVSTDGITNWFDYFFHDVERKTALLVTGLPAYADPTVRVTIEGNGQSAVELGILSIGLAKNLGETQHDGARIGIDDYSRKDKDDFGNFTILERAYNKNGSFQCRIPKAAVNGVFATLAQFRATPAFYSAADEYGATLIFGWPTSWQIEIDYPLESLVSIEIQGLT